MTNPTPIMPYVLEYLSLGKWVYGGLIGRDVGSHTRHKASVVERRLREYVTGRVRFLENRYVPNPDRTGGPVVMYRLKAKKK